MPSQLNFNPMRMLDSSAIPIAGALAYFYKTGTTEPVTVYTDNDLGTPHPSPLAADADGILPPVFTDGATALKVDVTTKAGGTVNGFPIDPVQLISSTGSAAAAVSFAPITGNDATNIQDAIQNLTDWKNTAEDFEGDTSPFATAAQGVKADSAVQNDDILADPTLSDTSVNKTPNTPSTKAYIDAADAALTTIFARATVTCEGGVTAAMTLDNGFASLTNTTVGTFVFTFDTERDDAGYNLNFVNETGITDSRAFFTVPRVTRLTTGFTVKILNTTGTAAEYDFAVSVSD